MCRQSSHESWCGRLTKNPDNQAIGYVRQRTDLFILIGYIEVLLQTGSTGMTDINHMMQQNVIEYESRLKHFDNLIERAHKGVGKNPEHAEIRDSLERLKQERDRFSGWIEKLRLKPLGNWRVEEIEMAGPMGIWDAVGQQLEKLVERIEH